MIETKKSFCRFCHVFCGIEVDVDAETGRATALRGDRKNPYSRGYTCIKGRAMLEELYHPERLLSSKKRANGSWQDVSATQAFAEIAPRLNAIRERFGPRAIAAYVSSGAGFSAGIPMTKVWFSALGSPNYYSAFTIDCPCYVVAAHRVFGTLSPPIDVYGGFSDLERAEVGMFIGNNPITSHSWGLGGPFPAKRLRDARARGMKVIVVDPRRTDMARVADLYLPVRPGEDATLLAGMVRIIIEEQLYDREYVGNFVSGLEDLRAAVRDFDLAYVAERTGVAAALVREAARLFAQAKTGAARMGSGLTMSQHANVSTHLVYTLNALCGRIDRLGGLLYYRQVFAPPLPARFEVPLFSDTATRVRGLRGLYIAPGFVEMPTATLPDEILEPGEGQIRALIVQGGNPVAVFPDQAKTVRALKALELLVVVDPFLTATARFAHYVLAPKHFLERADLTHTPLPVPIGQVTAPVVAAPGDLIEEWELGWELARHMGIDLKIPGLTPDRRPSSEEVMSAFWGHGRVSLDEARRYPSGHIFGDLVVGAVVPAAISHPDRRMALGHPDALAELRAVRKEATVVASSFAYRLTTMRLPHAYNSKGHNLPSLRGKYGTNEVLIHPADLKALGKADGDLVIVVSERGRAQAVARASAAIQRGVIAMSHGWGLAAEHEHDVRASGSAVARLIADDAGADALTGMPLMNGVPVNLLPA